VDFYGNTNVSLCLPEHEPDIDHFVQGIQKLTRAIAELEVQDPDGDSK